MTSMNHQATPVVLIIFNRPQLTAQVYERVRAFRPERLFVVADGPRADRQGERELCDATRAVVSSPDWPCELVTNYSSENMGCDQRVSSGLDWVFQHCDRAMVLEDDCVPSPEFFTFCAEMLEHYKDDLRIMHVSGDNFQDGQWRGDGSYYFSHYTHSWGWGTWSRAWRYYDGHLSLWPEAYVDRWLHTTLDDQREAWYWEGVFQKQHRKAVDTWDYDWLFACWIRGGLAILPNRNLVSNVGVGPDSTHFHQSHSTLGLPTAELGPIVHPSKVVRNKGADRYTFANHIGDPGVSLGQAWLRGMRGRLALKSRMKRILGLSQSVS